MTKKYILDENNLIFSMDLNGDTDDYVHPDIARVFRKLNPGDQISYHLEVGESVKSIYSTSVYIELTESENFGELTIDDFKMTGDLPYLLSEIREYSKMQSRLQDMFSVSDDIAAYSPLFGWRNVGNVLENGSYLIGVNTFRDLYEARNAAIGLVSTIEGVTPTISLKFRSVSIDYMDTYEVWATYSDNRFSEVFTLHDKVSDTYEYVNSAALVVEMLRELIDQKLRES